MSECEKKEEKESEMLVTNVFLYGLVCVCVCADVLGGQ